MKFTGKYTIITGVTSAYKINPENPKYFAKFINDNISCYGHTENEAVKALKELYQDYKNKNKIHGISSNQVLNISISLERFEKHSTSNNWANFLNLIGESPDAYIDDESTV